MLVLIVFWQAHIYNLPSLNIANNVNNACPSAKMWNLPLNAKRTQNVEYTRQIFCFWSRVSSGPRRCNGDERVRLRDPGLSWPLSPTPGTNGPDTRNIVSGLGKFGWIMNIELSIFISQSHLSWLSDFIIISSTNYLPLVLKFWHNKV